MVIFARKTRQYGYMGLDGDNISRKSCDIVILSEKIGVTVAILIPKEIKKLDVRRGRGCKLSDNPGQTGERGV